MDGRRDHHEATCASHVNVRTDLAALVIANIYSYRQPEVAVFATIRAAGGYCKRGWQPAALML
jgi:hypothetical protein